MDSHSWVGLALLVLALGFLVVVVAAEAGLMASNRGRLRFLASRGVSRAETVQNYVQERQALLGALAIARILSVVVTTALALFILTRQGGSTWTAVGIAAAGSVVVLTLLQAVPRFLVSQSPERWSILLSPFIGVVRAVFGRPAWLLDLPGRALLRVRALRGDASEPGGEEEDLVQLMEAEEANGGIEEEERQMIRGIINLEETPAREIMVPRIDIVAVEAESDFDEVLERVTAALKAEGFGVLTEIDVKATLKKKLDVEFRRYHILGACNPPLALRALTAEPAIGLLLPCNVVVAERPEGGTTVSAIAPMKMFAVVDNSALDPIVDEVDGKLKRVLDSI